MESRSGARGQGKGSHAPRYQHDPNKNVTVHVTRGGRGARGSGIESACAEELCRGGHFRPPLRPEMAASAQMFFVKTNKTHWRIPSLVSRHGPCPGS
jgi:hypothetical protein